MADPSQLTRGRIPTNDAPPEPHRFSLFKKRLPLVLGAVTGLVVCILGLFVVIALNGKPSQQIVAPSSTANSICTDLQAADYAALYAVLTPSLQQQGANAQAEFITSQRQLDIFKGKVTNCSYQIQQSDATQATVNYSIARGTQSPQVGQVVLTNLNGSWRIADYDTNIV